MGESAPFAGGDPAAIRTGTGIPPGNGLGIGTPDAALPDSEHLVQQASSGSMPAVEVLLARYLPGLRAYVRLRAGPAVRARESVSDLVQSTCREVFEHLDRFRWGGEAGFRRWLYATALRRILKKHAFHTAGKRDVGREVPLAHAAAGSRSGEGVELAAYAASFSTPSGVAIAREQAARIEAAFDALTEEQRELIVQSRLMGFGHREIAAALGKSEGAVRVALHRALARLAAALDAGG
jgi:RNA polymerase sigma-70 factor (ECF subfamily)